MIRNTANVVLETNPRSRSVDLYLVDLDEYFDFSKAAWVSTSQVESFFGTSASLQLTRSQAVQLLEALVRSGVSPFDTDGGPEHIKALENHINDLRKILFKSMEIS